MSMPGLGLLADHVGDGAGQALAVRALVDLDACGPSWPGRTEIGEQVARGDRHVLRNRARIDAALRFLRSDPYIWGRDETPAAYVHGLMVDRNAAGRGLGEAMLHWAADRGRAEGAHLLRLDCAESNPPLRAYYPRPRLHRSRPKGVRTRLVHRHPARKPALDGLIRPRAQPKKIATARVRTPRAGDGGGANPTPHSRPV